MAFITTKTTILTILNVMVATTTALAIEVSALFLVNLQVNSAWSYLIQKLGFYTVKQDPYVVISHWFWI